VEPARVARALVAGAAVLALVILAAGAAQGGSDVPRNAGGVAAPDSVAGPTDSTGARERERSTGGKVWAVVVGIDDYPGSGYDLGAGVADAQDVDAALDAAGVAADHRRVLLDTDAGGGAVRSAVAWLADRAGPDDTAVLFFSGHVRRVGDRDADPEDHDEALLLADGSELVDGDLAVMLEDVDARMWIGIAGCYGAGFDDLMRPGRVLTAAAPEADLAYENDRLGRTYLVEYLVRRGLLGGEPGTSIQDAFAAAVDGIRRDYPKRIPVMIDMAGGPVTLVPGA
jgi:hypothetical protein